MKRNIMSWFLLFSALFEFSLEILGVAVLLLQKHYNIFFIHLFLSVILPCLRSTGTADHEQEVTKCSPFAVFYMKIQLSCP